MSDTPTRAGRKAGEPNKVRVVKGQALGTRDFTRLLMDTIDSLKPEQQTIAGVLALWNDPSWLLPQAKADLRACVERLAAQGNLIRESRGVYRAAEPAVRKFTAIADFQDLAHTALKAAGGIMTSRELRRALGYSYQEAKRLRLYEALSAEGSRVRRDFRDTRLYNLPMKELRNLVLDGRWAFPILRMTWMHVGKAKHLTPGARPWRTLIDGHLTNIGLTIQVMRQARELELVDLLQHEGLVKAIDAARNRNPARTSKAERVKFANKIEAGIRTTRAGDEVTRLVKTEDDAAEESFLTADELRVAFLHRIEEPAADFLDPTHFDDSDYRYTRADFFIELAAVLDCDPVSLSWGAYGPAAGWGQNAQNPEPQGDEEEEEVDEADLG